MTDQERPAKFYLVGHAHIDASWLWTRHETIHVVLPNTFRDMLALIADVDGFVYAQTSAQLYAWTQRYYPRLFEKVRQAVQDGRWEVVGGSWVEHSGLLLGEESWVRQYLVGQRYFREHLGCTARTAWLPDTFGFPWTMPQVLANFGIKTFYASKLRYEVNRYLPERLQKGRSPAWDEHVASVGEEEAEREWAEEIGRLMFQPTLFHWKGPDGSEVLTTIPNLYYWKRFDSYQFHNLPGDKELFARAERAALHEGAATHVLMPFGEGDHGGGPLRKILNEARRRVDRSCTSGGCPPTPQETETCSNCGRELPPRQDAYHFAGAAEFFTDLGQACDLEKLSRYEDELYLATHRGTLTSEVFVKVANRRLEELVGDLERLAVIGVRPDSQRLETLWRGILFGQVHDNLDGSSSEAVYQEAATDYRDLELAGRELLEEGLRALGDEGQAVRAFNGLPWRRRVELELEEPAGGASQELWLQGAQVSSQRVTTLDGGARRLVQVELPPTGHVGLEWRDGTPRSAAASAREDLVLENEFLRAEVDAKSGGLVSLFCKRLERELLGPTGARFLLYPDAEERWSVWNVQLGQQGARLPSPRASNPGRVESGPLRDVVQLVFRRCQPDYSVSRKPRSYKGAYRILLRVSLSAGRPALDFEAAIDWHAQHQTLRWEVETAFPVHRATYEQPFGRIQRFATREGDPGDEIKGGRLDLPPRGWETRDRTKEENAALRWVDITANAGDAGLLLLNDGRYAFSLHEGKLRMTVLRCGKRHTPFNVKALWADYYTDQSLTPYVDQGDGSAPLASHRLRWSLVPHRGDVDALAPVRMGLEFNHSPRVSAAGASAEQGWFLEVGPEHVVSTALKPAEDDPTQAVLRLSETRGEACLAWVKIARPLAAVTKVDMMETGEFLGPHAVEHEALGFEVPLRPFEAATFLLSFAGA
jgi:alpha-mannosidase